MTEGPLHGVRVIELGGLGPGPHAAMMLADQGADVIRVERPGAPLSVGAAGYADPLQRSRRSVALDVKNPADLQTLLQLIDTADVLIEGFRPGVAERLGLGPEVLHARHAGLIYGRVTGWGQDGPLAATAGHDINYIARTGALHALSGADGRPPVPLPMLGDFGGGSLLLVIGIQSALLERHRSGLGQVVDAAMVDGASQLLQLIWSLRGAGRWNRPPGQNLLDGGMACYQTYRCADDGWVAVGALEPQFYAALLTGLQLDPAELPAQMDSRAQAELKERFAEVFSRRTRDEWTAVFAGTDACVTPVLSLAEAADDEYLTSRGSLIELGGVVQAGPAPRFSRSVAAAPTPAPVPGADTAAVLADWGVTPADPTLETR